MGRVGVDPWRYTGGVGVDLWLGVSLFWFHHFVNFGLTGLAKLYGLTFPRVVTNMGVLLHCITHFLDPIEDRSVRPLAGTLPKGHVVNRAFLNGLTSF